MKKILAVNIGSKVFGAEFNEACLQFGIPATVVRSRNCCFVLRDGEATLYHKNEKILPEEYAYVFIRVTGEFALMTSLISQFFKFHTVALSDNVYLQHTQNEEKITQMLLFTLAKLSIPNTVLFPLDGYQENKETILSGLSFPCVLKINGSQGRGVWKIADQTELENKIADLAQTYEMAMVQEYIPNSYDMRVIYMHGDIIGAIKRSSTDGFLNNVSRGGTVEPVELTPEETELTLKACAVLGRSFAGVDVVRTEQGSLLFEVNLGPQIYGFESATKINVPLELLKRIQRDIPL